MKLVDIQRAAALRDERQTAISRHNWLESFRKPHPFQNPTVSVQGVTFDGVWDEIAPVLLSHQRTIIERIEAELRNDFGIEVEPHFKTDADGWLKPTGELAEELTKRGYTLVQTGGGCTAWVKVMADGDNVVVTDTQGTSDAGYDGWVVGRYDGDDWENGDAASSDENDKAETIWQVIERFENTPRAKAEG